MRVIVTSHSGVLFAGVQYAKGDEIPLEVMPSQRHLEALVSCRRVRVDLDEADLLDASGAMRCSTCGRGGLKSDLDVSLHRFFAHGLESRPRPAAGPVASPGPAKGSRGGKKGGRVRGAAQAA